MLICLLLAATHVSSSLTVRYFASKCMQAIRNLYTWGGGAIYSRANLTLANSAFYYNQVQPIVRSSTHTIPALIAFS